MSTGTVLPAHCGLRPPSPFTAEEWVRSNKALNHWPKASPHGGAGPTYFTFETSLRWIRLKIRRNFLLKYPIPIQAQSRVAAESIHRRRAADGGPPPCLTHEEFVVLCALSWSDCNGQTLLEISHPWRLWRNCDCMCRSIHTCEWRSDC